jgi:predicted nucleic acid-binding protein
MHLGLAEELPVFFDRVLVPKAVQREVNRKERFRYRLNRLYRGGFYDRCVTADEVNIRLLPSELGEGESEALIQAQEQGASFFIADEKRAREVAANLSLRCVGTVRLLARLNREDRAPDPRSLVTKLRRDRAFRVSREVVTRAIELADEPI